MDLAKEALSSSFVVLVGLVLVFFTLAGPVTGCETGGPSDYLLGVDSIGLEFDSVFSTTSISTALGVWDGCTDFGISPGIDFPDFVGNPDPGQVDSIVEVNFYNQRSPSEACGGYLMGEVRIYAENSIGQSCSCGGDYGPTIAHEIGHIHKKGASHAITLLVAMVIALATA